MKQSCPILLLLMAAVCHWGPLQAAPISPAPDTLTQYIIDSKPVDQFDGSQLEGKTIVSYRISTVRSSVTDAIQIHYIQTKGASKSADLIYVIDGKQASKRKFENLNPAAIQSITIVKNGSQPEVRQYPGWENGVILVETKEVAESSDGRDNTVNIGYGEADKRDVSYSIATVKPEEKEFYTNIFEYLRGKVPGIQVRPDNTIVIRGVGTFMASTDPLVLVDGVEIGDISTINPHDVYSVDVLKDASTAIYGVKGANGVILITTKVGQQAKMQKAAAKKQAK